MQEQLLGHLLGVLDESEQESVEACLKRDPQLSGKLAELRRRLEPLEAIRRDFDPPADLAKRTCRLVAAEDRRQSRLPQSPPAAEARRRPMSPEAAPPSRTGGLRWHDVAIAATVLVAATLLTAPAIQNSRFHAQVIGCQDNLRELGLAMKRYARKHGGYFPRTVRQDRTTAGSYAIVLLRDDLLSDASRVICPGSSLARRNGFHVPSSDEVQTASAEKLQAWLRAFGRSYGGSLGYIRDGVYQDTKDLQRPNFAVIADVPDTNLPGYQSDNHGGRGQNVLFENRCVRFLTSPKPDDQADDIFHNDDGLVAPGTHRDDSVIVPAGTRLIWVGGSNR